MKVNPAVTADGAIGARTLEIEGAVYLGDQIVANPDGLAQIRFVDNTRIVIGPNSRLTIDKFVFNPDNTARELTIHALKGVFRFISGDSPHDVYSIRTPTMVLGVRGTVVDFAVRGADSAAAFIEGSGDVCDTGGTCVVAEADCAIHVVPVGGGVTTPGRLETQQRLSVFFPFIESQTGLAPGFTANTTVCGAIDSRPFGAPAESDSPRESYQESYQ